MSGFIRWNNRISKAMTPSHLRQYNTFSFYYKIAGLLFAMPDNSKIMDVGAGRHWTFPLSYKTSFGLNIVGLDIDKREMEGNEALDSTIEADASGEWPVEPESIDVITSFSGVEHFPDNAAFLRNVARTLRPGGALIAQFPNGVAPFSLANRMQPEWLTRRLFHALHPTEVGIIGFRTYYDKTTYRGFSAAAKEAGLEIDYYVPGYFWQGYASFFFPLYLLIMLYNYFALATGLKSLAGYHLFVLRRPGPHAEIKYG